MLDWLKTIVGDHYTEDIDKQVSAEIGKGFVAKADFNAKNDELKKANDTIKGLQDAAKKFEGADINGLKAQFPVWEATRCRGGSHLDGHISIHASRVGSDSKNVQNTDLILDESIVESTVF